MGNSEELMDMGFKHYESYEQLGALDDLNKAIEICSNAISITSPGHSEVPSWIGSLGALFDIRFRRLGELADIEKAIEHCSQAVSLTHPGHSDLPSRLDSLGIALDQRFQRLGKLEDLEKAIDHKSQAVLFTPPGHSDMPSRIDSLGVSLSQRFQRLGELQDLEKAIDHKSQAVSLTVSGHSDMPRRLHSLSVSLHMRFQRLGELADMEKAIEYFSQAVLLTPPGHSDMPNRLVNLGVSLHERFLRLGKLEDLEKAIDHKSQAVSLTPLGHPDMPSRLDSLSASLHMRFQRLGELADMDKAIEYSSQAVSLTPTGHSERPRWIHSLGVSLDQRFQRLGELEDLDKAIDQKSQAVLLTPPGHPDMPRRLDSLSASVHKRFQRLGELADMDKAIECSSQAVALTPSGHSDMPGQLHSLGVSLHERFQRLGKLEDLEKAIDHKSKAVSLTPPGHSDMPRRLDSLSASLDQRFQMLGKIEDLEKGIEYSSQAVSLTPLGHPDMPRRLDSLSASLHIRFRRLGELADIEKAIEYSNQAVSLTPSGHPDLPMRLRRLGEVYLPRSNTRTGAKFTDQSLDCFQRSAQCSAGRPIVKFESAIRWATLCEAHRTSSLLEAYKKAMLLLPQVVWLGSAVDRRYESITDVGGVTASAAAAAIKMGDYEQALEWLEVGRSIVWKQMLQLRTPLDELAMASPQLASKLQEVAHKLEGAGSHALIQRPILTNALSMEQAAQEHRRLAESWETLLVEAQSLPGFEHFLRPQKANELMQAARSSSVVVINVHKTRIDALVIRQNHNKISNIPLALSYDQISRARFQLEDFVRSRAPDNRHPVFHAPSSEDTLEGMLATLWEGVAKPVLDFLGYTHTPLATDLPRITWCTTGPLSFLPLHAAGDYGLGSRIFDYVISSYTPTLSALLSPPLAPVAFSGLLTVGQMSTLGMPSLPGTDIELTRIQEKAQGQRVTRLDGELATPTAVLAGMQEHSWVHLACHAMQNPTHPMQSAFYLHEGTLDLATITQKPLKHADLAFLSACQTATGDENLSDEAVHLAAGMLMTGYRTVIATMWSIGDADAPLIAETVYEHLVEGGTPDARKGAVALHKATERLREKVGEKAFANWVPYIHIGL